MTSSSTSSRSAAAGLGRASRRAGRILVGNRAAIVRVWSVPDRRELHRGHVDNGPSIVRMGTDAFYTLTQTGDQREVLHAIAAGVATPRRMAASMLESRYPRRPERSRSPTGAESVRPYLDGWDRGPRLVHVHRRPAYRPPRCRKTGARSR